MVDGRWIYLQVCVAFLCDVSGTNVDFVFPVQTEDDDEDNDAADAGGGDSNVDVSTSKMSEEHDVDAPTDVDKFCFEFYG